MSYRAFGDSVTEGYNATSASFAWVNVLGAAIGQTIVNLGKAGDMVPDKADEVYGTSAAAGDVSLLTLGINDQRIYGSDAVKRGYFERGLLAEAVWLATGARQTGISVAAETGTWENTQVYGIGRCARTAGSTKTFQVAGTTIYLGYILQNGQAGAFDVLIDGVSMGSFVTSASPPMTTYHGLSYGPQALRFAGLSAGVHTVQVVVSAGDRVYVDWVAGNEQAVKPRVLIGTVLRALSYVNGGSDANVDAYNTAIASIVTALQADGLNVTLVDLHAALNITSDLDTDGLHPNNAGHGKIAAAYQSALGAAPITYTEVKVYLGSDGKYYVGDGVEKREIALVG
jgi:lysophospholipase L1-like esterase